MTVRAYERVLSALPTGDGVQVAFCVESTALSVDGEAAVLAAGLARTLCDYGWDAFLVPRQRWRDLGQGVDVIVACSPRFVPSSAPGGPVLLGWAAQPAEFATRTDLAAYDGLLAPSELAAARLAESFDGPIALLPPAVDALLFPKGDGVAARQGTPAADSVAPLDRGLRRYASAVAVVCESPVGHRAHGVPPLTLLHAIAAGALPVATSRLGLVEFGLGDVDVATEAEGLAVATVAAAAEPGVAAVRAQRLRAVVWDRHTWRHRLAAFESAVESAKVARQEPRTTVAYFPDYAENPYQRMLYADTAAAGVRLVPLPDPIDSLVVRDRGDRLDDNLLHIQWTAPLLQNANGPFDATRRLEKFIAAVTEFRARGGHLVWTVHNVLPHEVRFREPEIQLCEFLAQTADRVHVLGEETLAAALPYYRLPPEKVSVIPHASYLGVYPDWIGRDEARRRLGLLDGEIGILLFGVIRPYKGLDLLLDVFDRVLASDVRLRLLVAGRPSASPKVDEWRERCANHPRIVAALRYIDPVEVQVWMRATDLVILPYQAVLNSGALHLALAFGRPVVAPAVGVVASQVGPSFASTFAPGNADQMVHAIEDAVARLTTPAASAAALAAAESWSPAQMSRAFYSLVASLVPAAVPEPAR